MMPGLSSMVFAKCPASEAEAIAMYVLTSMAEVTVLGFLLCYREFLQGAGNVFPHFKNVSFYETSLKQGGNISVVF